MIQKIFFSISLITTFVVLPKKGVYSTENYDFDTLKFNRDTNIAFQVSCDLKKFIGDDSLKNLKTEEDNERLVEILKPLTTKEKQRLLGGYSFIAFTYPQGKVFIG